MADKDIKSNKKPGKKVKVAKYNSDVRKATIEAVCEYLKLGYNLSKSCDIAFVARPTFIDWCKRDPALRQKVQYYRHYTSLKARETVHKIIESGIGVEESKWWLERKDKKDFSPRTEIVEVDEDTDLEEEKDFSDIDEIIKKNTQ